MKILVASVLTLLGAAVGLCAGSVGVYYGCVLIDSLQYPQGVPPGGGLTAVGWLLWFVTIPGGLIGGGVFGFYLGLKLGRQRSEKGPEDTP